MSCGREGISDENSQAGENKYSAIAFDKNTVSLATSRIAGSEKRQAKLSDKLRSGWPTTAFTLGVILTC
jgi:hypothetical protein